MLAGGSAEDTLFAAARGRSEWPGAGERVEREAAEGKEAQGAQSGRGSCIAGSVEEQNRGPCFSMSSRDALLTVISVMRIQACLKSKMDRPRIRGGLADAARQFWD